MEKQLVQEIVRKGLDEIQEKVIPVVTEKVMFSFNEGVHAGMELGYAVTRELTTSWLYSQLHKGAIEVKDIEKLIASYSAFLEANKVKE